MHVANIRYVWSGVSDEYHVWSGCEANIMCGRVCSKYQVCVVGVLCGKYHVWSGRVWKISGVVRACVENIMCGQCVWQISGMCGLGVSGERPQSDLEQMLFASQTSH